MPARDGSDSPRRSRRSRPRSPYSGGSPRATRVPDGRAGLVGAEHRAAVPRRDRRDQPLARSAHHVPVPGLRARLVDDHDGRASVHDLDAVPRDRRARVLPRARPCRVLHLLRGAARAHVPADRRVGRGAPRLRRDQVLPVHDGGLGVPARRDPVPVREGECGRRRHVRPAVAGGRGRGLAGRHGAVGVPRVLHRVRGEGADLPSAHVAAGRAHRGADGRLGAACRRPAEGRRLRPDPVQHVVVPRGDEVLRRRRSRCSR